MVRPLPGAVWHFYSPMRCPLISHCWWHDGSDDARRGVRRVAWPSLHWRGAVRREVAVRLHPRRAMRSRRPFSLLPSSRTLRKPCTWAACRPPTACSSRESRQDTPPLTRPNFCHRSRRATYGFTVLTLECFFSLTPSPHTFQTKIEVTIHRGNESPPAFMRKCPAAECR